MHPANAYQQGFPPGQGRTILNSPSFSIVTGQGGDPSKYVVKDQSGSPLLWVLDSAQSGQGQSNTGRSLVVKDAGQYDVLKLWFTTGAQATTLLDVAGNVIGSVSIASKSVKEHKKGKDKEKDKDGKRQIVLQNPANQPLLTMSGKGKHGGGNVEMKIKSTSPKTSKSQIPGAHGADQKHKEKKDKDKDKEKKDKDKDKDKKNKEVAEVTGSVGMGFQVRITQSNLNLQERNNIVGLLISYMELEKQGPSMSQYPTGVMNPQQQPYYPQQPGMPVGQFPGQQPFHPGQQAFQPGQQPFHPGQQAFQPGQQPFHPGQQAFQPGQQQYQPGQQTFQHGPVPGGMPGGQMGFYGGPSSGPQQSGQTFQGQYPPPH